MVGFLSIVAGDIDGDGGIEIAGITKKCVTLYRFSGHDLRQQSQVFKNPSSIFTTKRFR